MRSTLCLLGIVIAHALEAQSVRRDSASGALPVSRVELPRVRILATDSSRAGRNADGSVRISREAMRTLPLGSRSLSAVVRVDPRLGIQQSVAGGRWTGTELRVDGMRSRGGLRAGEAQEGPLSIPLDALESVEVNASPFDVAVGRHGGGVIQSTLRRGRSIREWQLLSLGQTAHLGARTDFSGRTAAERPQSIGRTGLSVGGPLGFGRLHGFAAIEREQRWDAVRSGEVRSLADEVAVGIAADSIQRLLQILQSRYGLIDTVGQLGVLRRTSVADAGSVRIDAALSATQQLTWRLLANRWNQPLGGGVDQGVALRESRADLRMQNLHSSLSLHSSWGSRWNHEATFAWMRSSRSLSPISPAVPRGFVQIRSALADGSLANTTVQFGGNRLAPDVGTEQTVQLQHRLDRRAAHVTWSLGGEHLLADYRTRIAESQGGLFVFPSLAALDRREPVRFTRTVPLESTTPETVQRVVETGAYAQLLAVLRPGLRMTTGIRWDGQMFLAPSRTMRAPRDLMQWQPRMEIVWFADTLTGTALRVGVGRFAASLPAYLYHNQLLHDGRRLADVDLRGSAVPIPDFAGYRSGTLPLPGTPAVGGRPYQNPTGTVRAPITDQLTVGIQRRVGGRLAMEATMTWNRQRLLYHYLDANLRDTPAFLLANEAGRGVYVPAASIVPTTGATDVQLALRDVSLGRVLVLGSPAAATQRLAVLRATLDVSRRLTSSLAYSWSVARDNSTFGCCLARTATTFTPVATDPRRLDLAWASSDLDQRHRIVSTLNWRLGGGWQISTLFRAASGRPYSLVVDGDLNGDEANGNDLAFAFDPDSPTTAPEVAAGMRRLLATSSPIGRYLRSVRGQMTARNALRTPWTQRMDLHVERSIRSPRGSAAVLLLDLFNVANLLNHQWGGEYLLPSGISAQNPVVNRVPLLRITGFDPQALRYRYAVNEAAGTIVRGGDPWQLQIGLRLGR